MNVTVTMPTPHGDTTWSLPAPELRGFALFMAVGGMAYTGRPVGGRPRPGIPIRKLTTPGRWEVTAEECRSALDALSRWEKAEEALAALRTSFPARWQLWVAYLRAAARSGFHVDV